MQIINIITFTCCVVVVVGIVQMKEKLRPQLLTLTRYQAVSQLSAFVSRVETLVAILTDGAYICAKH